jgi:preprotein translocase subunit SecD
LSIGIIVSMFTAIFITRLQIDLWIKFYKPKNILS